MICSSILYKVLLYFLPFFSQPWKGVICSSALFRPGGLRRFQHHTHLRQGRIAPSVRNDLRCDLPSTCHEVSPQCMLWNSSIMSVGASSTNKQKWPCFVWCSQEGNPPEPLAQQLEVLPKLPLMDFLHYHYYYTICLRWKEMILGNQWRRKASKKYDLWTSCRIRSATVMPSFPFCPNWKILEDIKYLTNQNTGKTSNIVYKYDQQLSTCSL